MSSEHPELTARPATMPRWVVVLLAGAGAFTWVVALVAGARSEPDRALAFALEGVMLASLAGQGLLRKPLDAARPRRFWRGQSVGFLLASASGIVSAAALLVVSAKNLL